MYNDVKFINSVPVNKNLPRDLVILSQPHRMYLNLHLESSYSIFVIDL